MRALYRLLSIWWQLKAASRGPGAFVRQRLRSAAHRALARAPGVVARRSAQVMTTTFTRAPAVKWSAGRPGKARKRAVRASGVLVPGQGGPCRDAAERRQRRGVE